MARTLTKSTSPTPERPRTHAVAPARPGPTGRTLERVLLLWNVPLVLFAAWGIAQAQRHPSEAFVPAFQALGIVWAACFALHLLLTLTRFDGDPLILPLLSLIFTVGAAYHLDLGGPASPGLTPAPYTKGVFLAVAVLAVVTAGGRWFKRLSILVEEKVWWRIAGDRPYYDSAPFHLLLLAMMGLLALLLMVKGIRAQNGALVQVPLPFGIKFTPSEIIRLVVAFFLADYLGRNSRILRNLRQPVGRIWPLNRIYLERRTELLVLLTTVLLYCAFFYVFRDFGPAVVIIALTLAALYAATGRLLTPLLIGAGLAVAIAVPTWKHLAFHTAADRIEMWLNPWDTHFPNGDHLARILWAIASGGWFGMGVGTQELPQTLPLARNDAAFAGIAATMGMWVGLATLGLYAALTWRGLAAARQAPTDRTRLLGFTLTGLLAFEAVWIAGAMVRAFPFTGINLPFISSGLTSMFASAVALGTIWNLSRSHVAPDATEASPEVLRGVSKLTKPMMIGFALPALGLLAYGCPWILGDRTMTQTAWSLGYKRERSAFTNPYLEAFRKHFTRGRIFSADGKLLAVSSPGPLGMDVIRKEAPELERPLSKLDEGERYYPLGTMTSQLIGWNPQGRFSAGEGSIEATWDSVLRGYQPNRLSFYWRTRNNPLVRPPEPTDLQLTVRTDIQKFAAERLARAVKQWKGAGGAAVVYDVSTGAVLAAATSPSFDPNGMTLERMQQYLKQHSRTQVLTNKALSRSALYFPGSTFKLVTAAAAMDEAVTGGVTCRNGRNAEPIAWEFDGKRWRRDPGKISDYASGGHGAMRLESDLDHALTVSCNVFFGKLAAVLGPERLRRAMLNAELKNVPSTEQLAEHLPYDGFGQIDVKTSPLEMAMIAGAAGAALEPDRAAVSTRPSWVQALVTKSGKKEPEGVAGAPDHKAYAPFPPEVAYRLREMMIQVVESPSGTAHAAFYRGGAPVLPGLTIGGKTGTAEFEKQVTVNGKKRTTIGRHAWFVGFARDQELQPRTLAFAVLVEDVRRGGTGGHVCAPVARDLIDRILPKPGDNPSEPNEGLERFYQQQIRPRLGPAAPIVDFIQKLLQHR
jgi:peptidoglycan glycosyltransferase